jgi:hypothetical protein
MVDQSKGVQSKEMLENPNALKFCQFTSLKLTTIITSDIFGGEFSSLCQKNLFF